MNRNEGTGPLAEQLALAENYKRAFCLIRPEMPFLPAGMSVAEAAVQMERAAAHARHQFVANAWSSMQCQNEREN